MPAKTPSLLPTPGVAPGSRGIRDPSRIARNTPTPRPTLETPLGPSPIDRRGHQAPGLGIRMTIGPRPPRLPSPVSKVLPTMSSEKRLIAFLILSVVSMYGMNYALVKTGVLPDPSKKPPAKVAKENPAKPADDKPKDAPKAEALAKADEKAKDQPKDAAAKADDKPKAGEPEKPKGPAVAMVKPGDLILGSASDPAADAYRLQVGLSQRGAAVRRVEPRQVRGRVPQQQARPREAARPDRRQPGEQTRPCRCRSSSSPAPPAAARSSSTRSTPRSGRSSASRPKARSSRRSRPTGSTARGSRWRSRRRSPTSTSRSPRPTPCARRPTGSRSASSSSRRTRTSRSPTS